MWPGLDLDPDIRSVELAQVGAAIPHDAGLDLGIRFIELAQIASAEPIDPPAIPA